MSLQPTRSVLAKRQESDSDRAITSFPAPLDEGQATGPPFGATDMVRLAATQLMPGSARRRPNEGASGLRFPVQPQTDFQPQGAGPEEQAVSHAAPRYPACRPSVRYVLHGCDRPPRARGPNRAERGAALAQASAALRRPGRRARRFAARSAPRAANEHCSCCRPRPWLHG